MKKIISLLLALVLCLSLVACGVDKQYTALLDHLQSGNYEGIKNELAALSPDFRAEQEQMTTDAEKLAKYESLINLLEADDYDGALADVTARIPVPPEPACTEVEINIDNWQEYLELKPIDIWDENDFGDTDTLRCVEALYVRPEFADKIVWDKTNLIIEFSIEHSFVECEIDFENKEWSIIETLDVTHVSLDTYTLDAASHTRYDEFIQNHVIGTHNWASGTDKNMYEVNNHSMGIVVVQSVERIQGSIYLLDS